MRILGRLLVGLLVIVGALLGAARWRYGGGATFPDRTGQPSLPETALEVVADLDWPPGNIAVALDGRLFFTFHPEASPPAQVVDWVDDQAVPYPRSLPEELAYQSVLSILIDRQGRLWALDNAKHGLGPRASSPST